VRSKSLIYNCRQTMSMGPFRMGVPKGNDGTHQIVFTGRDPTVFDWLKYFCWWLNLKAKGPAGPKNLGVPKGNEGTHQIVFTGRDPTVFDWLKYVCWWLNLKAKGPAGPKNFTWESYPVNKRNPLRIHKIGHMHCLSQAIEKFISVFVFYPQEEELVWC